MIDDSEFSSRPLTDSGEILFDGGGTADCYKRIVGNRAYCFKRPKPQYRTSEAYMDHFRKEFTLGIELEHPNIVRYFDYGTDEKGPFIKMDYVDGDNLETFTAKHPYFFDDKQNRQQLLNELLDALDYLHGKQTLHLDLKPRNILITHKGHHVKLVDLGFGWTEGYLQEAGYSRDYCAPEQINGKSDQLSPATDLYALGKIMQQYHLAKDSVVKRCLCEQPQDRFQSIEALREALRPQRWPVVLLAVAAVAALGWMLTMTNKEAPTVPVAHDTIYIMQVDTVFVPEPQPELTLEDSLTLFKNDLQATLAPTFSYWYMMIDNMFTNQPDLTNDFYLEWAEFYINKGLEVSRGIIKEKINVLHLSKTAKPHYEKAAQEVTNYYLKDYKKLKKRLEKELAVS